MSKKISFVIPCYRSENTVGKVIDEIINIISDMQEYDYEIIAVDDFSPDNVFNVLKCMASKNEKIKVIGFSKNFGQHAGMMAGVRASTGDYVVFLDDEGQCPIDRLNEMIKPLEEGYDITIAEYGKKKQSTFKNICSSLNEFAANILIDKPKDIQMGNFMAIKRFVADEINNYKGPYPYISGLLFRSSNRILNVSMEERKRMEGKTTYTFRKMFSLWLNSFTAFSIKPLRLATVMGIICSMLGFLYGIFVIIRKIINPAIMMGYSSLMAVILFIGGMILFVVGIIGEYIGRIYMCINETPQYVIKKRVNLTDEDIK